MPDNKTAVITGANRGIGLELARHYAREGLSVFGVCRQTSDEPATVAALVTNRNAGSALFRCRRECPTLLLAPAYWRRTGPAPEGAVEGAHLCKTQ